MKRLLIVILTISVISCTQNEKPVDYAVFSGTIENANSGKLSIRDSNNNIQEITVNQDGTFTDTIKNINKGYFSFQYGNETTSLYLKPGDNINLNLNPAQFDESIQYTGNGSTENNYLAKKFLQKEGFRKILAYQYLGSLDEKTFIQKIDSIKNIEMALLNKQTNLDRNFKKLEEADITYNWAGLMNRHESYKRYISKDDSYKASSGFYDFQKDLNLEDESLIDVRNYKNYLFEHYSLKAQDLAEKEKIDRDFALLKVISKDVKSPKIKDFLLYEASNFGISYTNDLKGFYDTFMANSTNEENKKDITEKYNKLIKLVKGNPSPKFVDYENFKGGTTSLNDLKGKYVYIDVWATWCGPCKAEIPSLKSTEKAYRGKKIEFVSMSIDKKADYDKWRAMVEKEELSGIQIFAPNDWKSDFVTNYGIMGIPRFILIDPEGNIVNSNAPRPSSPKLKELFNKLKI